MVRLKLEIKAELENVTDLKPASDDFEYLVKVSCTSCREVHPKLVSLNRTRELEVGGGRHGTANLIWRCSFCRHEHSAKFDPSPVRPYTEAHSGNFSDILVVECRGLELIGFEPQGTWTCKGAESGTIFDVDFEDGEWEDYDEKKALSVRVSFMESRWNRA
ncbi:hypothetical protein BU15DRAFT_85991 [Melanogaster broomeanus]|nr:hypothetical protein BU15DRAFT_85991 [Melanogaster broomeanus]